jgi:hypothetical protein
MAGLGSISTNAPSGSSQHEITLTFGNDIHLLDVHDTDGTVNFTITNIEFLP